MYIPTDKTLLSTITSIIDEKYSKSDFLRILHSRKIKSQQILDEETRVPWTVWHDNEANGGISDEYESLTVEKGGKK